MKVIRHAGVNSRMIILDDQARQQMTLHFNTTFRPSQASSGIQLYLLVCLIIQNNHPTTVLVYRMAGNFGGEFILADWQF